MFPSRLCADVWLNQKCGTASEPHPETPGTFLKRCVSRRGFFVSSENRSTSCHSHGGGEGEVSH